MRILLAIILAFTFGIGTVSADNWWDNPPPPPNADNTDYWPFDTYELSFKHQDSGPSVSEVYLSKIEQEPYWLWT